MVRKATRHSTFYPRQVIQLRWLMIVAMSEASHRKGGVPKRYTITCRCNSCGDEPLLLNGAVRAIQWLCDHNRHNTYVTGEEN